MSFELAYKPRPDNEQAFEFEDLEFFMGSLDGRTLRQRKGIVVFRTNNGEVYHRKAAIGGRDVNARPVMMLVRK